VTPRAMLFDLDSTLIHRGAAFQRYLEQLAMRFPAELPDAAALQAMHELDHRGARPQPEFCRLVADRFPGLGMTPGEVWHDFASGLTRAVPPDPEVVALVQRLGRRYRLAVVTNGSISRQREKLQRAGLEPLLPRVFISEALGLEKPDPRLFRAVLEQLELVAAEALFVGDDPLRDIAGAHAVGLPTCWIAHGRRFPPGVAPPDVAVQSVLELERVLA